MPGEASSSGDAAHPSKKGTGQARPSTAPPKPLAPPKLSVAALGRKAKAARHEKRASEKQKGGLFQEEVPTEPLEWATDASDRGRVCFVPREFWPKCAVQLSANVKGWRAVVSSIKLAKRGFCITCIGEEGTRNANVFVSLATARARGIIPLTD